MVEQQRSHNALHQSVIIIVFICMRGAQHFGTIFKLQQSVFASLLFLVKFSIYSMDRYKCGVCMCFACQMYRKVALTEEEEKNQK